MSVLGFDRNKIFGSDADVNFQADYVRAFPRVGNVQKTYLCRLDRQRKPELSTTLTNTDMVGKPVWQVCEVLTRFNGSDDSDYSVFISYPNGLRDYAFECSDSQLQLYNFLFAL